MIKDSMRVKCHIVCSICLFYVWPIPLGLQDLSYKPLPFREIHCAFKQGNVIELDCRHDTNFIRTRWERGRWGNGDMDKNDGMQMMEQWWNNEEEARWCEDRWWCRWCEDKYDENEQLCWRVHVWWGWVTLWWVHSVARMSTTKMNVVVKTNTMRMNDSIDEYVLWWEWVQQERVWQKWMKDQQTRVNTMVMEDG